MVHIRYDPEADALYAELRCAAGKVRTCEIDERRLDVDESGAAVGVELLFVSCGVNLEGLPEAERIAAAMRSFPRITP